MICNKGKQMSLHIYSNKIWSFWFRHKIRNQHTCDVGPVTVVKNGVISNEYSHGYGVFDADCNFVKASVHNRGRGFQLIPKKFDKQNIPYVDKDVIFLGAILSHFGDFLVNNLVRAYYLLNSKYRDYDIVFVNNKDIDPIPEYVYVFLELLKVSRKRVIILNKTTRFKNVYIPAQGWCFPFNTSEQCAKTFDTMAKNVRETKTKKYDKIYLSRDALKIRRTYGEKYVSDVFRKNGFKIIYPETLPLEKQIDLAHHCNVLAGCAGTALHLALFMKPGGTVIQIKRNSRIKDNSSMQYLINKTKKLNSVFISGSIEKSSSIHCTHMPQIIGVNKYMRRFFDENGFVYDKNMPSIDKQTWDEYYADLTSYISCHSSGIIDVIKRKFVKISACFVPGRERRARYRKKIKSLLNVE